MELLIDSHVHLTDLKFDADRDDVIARARQAGVAEMIAVADTLASVHEVIALAQKYENIYPTAGIHPHYAKTTNDAHLADLVEILNSHSNIVAVGETGLDLYYGKDTLAEQLELFEKQVRISLEFGLPLVIHCREAEQHILDILRKYPNSTGVMHCFSGDAAFCENVVACGLYVSFSGIITFKNSDNIREAARITPPDRLLVETDCPYLAPQGYRGKRNEPAYIVKTVECLAEILDVSYDNLVHRTTENTKTLFQLRR